MLVEPVRGRLARLAMRKISSSSASVALRLVSNSVSSEVPSWLYLVTAPSSEVYGMDALFLPSRFVFDRARSRWLRGEPSLSRESAITALRVPEKGCSIGPGGKRFEDELRDPVFGVRDDVNWRPVVGGVFALNGVACGGVCGRICWLVIAWDPATPGAEGNWRST